MGTSSDLSLVRRAHLAVVAHIRHTYTDYDQLLRVVPWADARRRVESQTLDKIVEWRGENDADADMIHDVLREVIVISDDENDNEEEGAATSSDLPQQPERIPPNQQNLVSNVPTRNIHTEPLILLSDGDADSEGESAMPLVSTRNPLSSQARSNHYRLGAQKLRNWEMSVQDPRFRRIPQSSEQALESHHSIPHTNPTMALETPRYDLRKPRVPVHPQPLIEFEQTGASRTYLQNRERNPVSTLLWCLP